MFNIFRKKTQIEELIAKNGIEHATDLFAEIIARKLTSHQIAYQFILEEIEGASMGNSASKRFALNSGIHPDEYRGAMRNSIREIDGPDGPQQLLTALSLQLPNNQELMAEFRCKIDEKIMQRFGLGKYESQKNPLNGGMRLEKAGVDILFIVKNDRVIYMSDHTDHLFSRDGDGDEKMDGRVVNIVFSGQSSSDLIEIFVAFDESDSYMMFTLQSGMLERLNIVAQEVFRYFSQVTNQSVFSPIERYLTQYIYTFKLYRKKNKYFMINNAQTQAYLIQRNGIKRDDVDDIKIIFWDESDK